MSATMWPPCLPPCWPPCPTPCFFVGRHIGHLVHFNVSHYVHFHVGHYVSHHVGHHIGHHNVVSMSQRRWQNGKPKVWQTYGRAGVGARDACASKNWFLAIICILHWQCHCVLVSPVQKVTAFAKFQNCWFKKWANVHCRVQCGQILWLNINIDFMNYLYVGEPD